jgi:hypothetical protein
MGETTFTQAIDIHHRRAHSEELHDADPAGDNEADCVALKPDASHESRAVV